MSRKPYDFIDTKNAFAVEQLFLSKLALIIDYYLHKNRDPPAGTDGCTQ